MKKILIITGAILCTFLLGYKANEHYRGEDKDI